MTKSVIDNAIFLSAMNGEDIEDLSTSNINHAINYFEGVLSSSIEGKRFGVLKSLLNNAIYAETIGKLKAAGAEIFEFDPLEIRLEGFTTLLNLDMKSDLPNYIKNDADKNIEISNIQDIMSFNLLDIVDRAPYGQQLFEGIVVDSTSKAAFEELKVNLNRKGVTFFKTPMDEFNLDAILSINNYHAGFAAVAKYPCLTIPMGYEKTGEPLNLTFIAKPFEELQLLQMGYAFEQLTKSRKLPNYYQ